MELFLQVRMKKLNIANCGHNNTIALQSKLAIIKFPGPPIFAWSNFTRQVITIKTYVVKSDEG